MSSEKIFHKNIVFFIIWNRIVYTSVSWIAYQQGHALLVMQNRIRSQENPENKTRQIEFNSGII